MIPKNPNSIGFLLYLLTLVIFFIVYFFFSGLEFFETSLLMNAFALPILYALGAFWSVKSHWNHHKMGFREAFKRAFAPMFLGGLLSIISIFSFLNFVDIEAKNLLNYQYVERQKFELNEEYSKAKKMLKQKEDIEDLEKKYKERIQSFAPERVKGKDMLSFSHFAGYFAAILIFYLVISTFLGAFFRTKTNFVAD